MRVERVRLVVLVVVAAIAVACGSGADGGSGSSSSTSEEATADPGVDGPVASTEDHPNIVVIISDDQRFDTVRWMPWLDAQDDWAEVGPALVSNPQCCPARASFLTGRYSWHTGVETLRDGADLDDEVTVATMLDEAGYRTALIGKYLNRYPFGPDPYVPPGWDHWAAYLGDTDYHDYDLYVDGEVQRYGSDPDDYSSDVFAALAGEFIRSTPDDQALFLYLVPNAPHRASDGPAEAAARHADACGGDEARIRRPNFNVLDTVETPAWHASAGQHDEATIDEQSLAFCRATRSLDDLVASVVDDLAEAGRLDDTYIVYTSDNGYAFGEHRITGKGDLYEEAIRVPMLVRGPGVRPGAVDRLTSNIDLTPTVLEWAGVEAPPGFVDGTSFAPDLRGDGETDPELVLLQGCRTLRAGTPVPAGSSESAYAVDGVEQACGGYFTGFGTNWGVRTATHTYVVYDTGERQLFDLRADPYQLTNLADDPAQAALVAELQAAIDEVAEP